MRDKTIVGFDRAELFGQALALVFYSIFGHMLPKHMIRNQNRAQKIAQMLNTGLAPHPEVVAKAVEDMPYEPFGVGGLKDTTKFDGNLAQQYQNQAQKATKYKPIPGAKPEDNES